LAAWDLGQGKSVLPKNQKISEAVTLFLLCKEFHCLPDEIERQDAKKIKILMDFATNFNKGQNSEMERKTKSK